MAFDWGGFAGIAFKWLSSFLFWGILLFLFVVTVLGSLYIRKRRKLIYPAIELTDLGAGKIGFKSHKAGWFKTKTIFFGLYDFGGEDVLMLKDGRVVQAGSSEDFHDINGKRGLLVIRKSDDPSILLPINKAGTSDKYVKKNVTIKGNIISKFLGLRELKKENEDLASVKKMGVVNPELLTEIAPADYRDASVKIINSSEKETRAKWEKLAPYVLFGTMAITFMITIILIVQMVKHGQTEAKDLILEVARQGCQSPAVQAIISGAP